VDKSSIILRNTTLWSAPFDPTARGYVGVEVSVVTSVSWTNVMVRHQTAFLFFFEFCGSQSSDHNMAVKGLIVVRLLHAISRALGL
jgi:hypothetical protein